MFSGASGPQPAQRVWKCLPCNEFTSLLTLRECGKAQIRIRLHAHVYAHCLLLFRFQFGLSRCVCENLEQVGREAWPMGKTFHGSLWSIHTAYASMKNCKWGNPEQFIMPGNSELRVGGHYFKWNFSRKIKIKTKNNNNRTENQGQWWKSIDFFCKLQMGWREPQVIEMLLWEHGPAVLHLVSMCLLWSRRCIGHWTHNNEQSGPVLGDADDKKANTKNYNRDNRESCGSTEKERLYQTLGVEQGQCRLPRRNDIHAESK